MVETGLDWRLQLGKDVELEFCMSHYSSPPQMARHRACQMEKHATAQKDDINVHYKCF